MSDASKILDDMNDRSREVFRLIVESYLDSGEPVGSRTLTRTMSEKVSAATVRNVMQDLEFLGLLDSPHISAGRIPTQLGLRMFVDGLLEVGIWGPKIVRNWMQRWAQMLATSESCSTRLSSAFQCHTGRLACADAKTRSRDQAYRVCFAGP